MFTGIIQAVGKVIKYDGKRLWISTPFRAARMGESISIDGVCLTVSARRSRDLAFDVGQQTQHTTTLGNLQVGSRVNMERALRIGDRLGGHWVSGHVEATGKLLDIKKNKLSWSYVFQIPKLLQRFVVPKGSIAIDGISLTVAAVKNGRIHVMIIPHTWSHTNLRDRKIGDKVNLEADLLAKYAGGRHYAIR